ncbi:MAG: (2Fe-2S)-binding protein [Deltaproteobacteria bacterium]|nr:(2Fe-2S)-binding protein [Deltaproteobacteria bacterium]
MSIRLTIDDVEVKAEPGEYVLAVARREGFAIPSLCHHESVAPIGACRVCLVQVTFGGKTTLSTSCNMLAEEGLQVVTDTPEVRAHRAMNLELLLARAPGSARVREMARQYGVTRTRFPQVAESALANCILCELCMRVCSRLGHDALSAIGRGDKKRIGPPFGTPSERCVGCASCRSVCPTACVFVRDTATSRTIWGKTFEFVLCKNCGAPVLTREHRQHALAHAGLPEDYYDVCEPCKQADAAGRFANVVW